MSAQTHAPIPPRLPRPTQDRNVVASAAQLVAQARVEPEKLLRELDSRAEGLTQAEVDVRLKELGTNEIAREHRQTLLGRLLDNLKNPLVILLTSLGVLSYATGDLRATVVIFVMVVLGVVLRFFQDRRFVRCNGHHFWNKQTLRRNRSCFIRVAQSIKSDSFCGCVLVQDIHAIGTFTHKKCQTHLRNKSQTAKCCGSFNGLAFQYSRVRNGFGRHFRRGNWHRHAVFLFARRGR